VRITRSPCKGQEGIEGRITGETQNTFLLQTNSGRKRIAKIGAAFEFPDLGIAAAGRVLQCRPEDRTKKMLSLAGKEKS
jgi:RNase P/RNase MRP subunit p29